MRLGWSGKSAYVNGKRTTITVEKLGNSAFICEKYGVDDAEQWCRDYIASLNDAAKLATGNTIHWEQGFCYHTIHKKAEKTSSGLVIIFGWMETRWGQPSL